MAVCLSYVRWFGFRHVFLFKLFFLKIFLGIFLITLKIGFEAAACCFEHVTHTFFSPPVYLIPLIGFRRCGQFVPSSKDSYPYSRGASFPQRSHFNVGMSRHNEILTSVQSVGILIFLNNKKQNKTKTNFQTKFLLLLPSSKLFNTYTIHTQLTQSHAMNF
jgi:hypothetical protein